jgi:hypothetical protein
MASVLDIAEDVFPKRLRLKAGKLSRRVFKMPLSKVLYLWRTLSDPLRGSIVSAGSEFIVIRHLPDYSDLVHVTDVVRFMLHGDINGYPVLSEKQVRLMVKGLYYHKLLSRYTDPSKKVVFELPLVIDLGEVVAVGNIDSIIIHDSKYIVVEHKSSNTMSTIRYGLLQVRLYWSILDELLPGKVVGAVVMTPTQTFEVDRPFSRREMRSLFTLAYNHQLTSYMTIASNLIGMEL